MPDQDTAPDRQRRRRGEWLVIAAAATVVVVIGGSLYGGLGGDDVAAPQPGETPAPLLLDSASASGPAEAAGAGGLTYEVVGELPTGPDSASVHHLTSSVTEDEVAGLAVALKLSGTPESQDGQWRVNGSGGDDTPVLTVEAEAPGSWSFERHPAGPPVPPDSDQDVLPELDDSSSAAAGAGRAAVPPAGPGPGQVEAASGEPLPETEALAAALPVLELIPALAGEPTADEVDGGVRTVRATAEVGGLPVHGWDTWASVGAQGQLVRAGGVLLPPAEGAEYPLVTAEQALRAGESRPTSGFATGLEPQPLPEEAPTAVPTTDADGVRVTDATLGLSPRTSGTERLLVPSWLYEVTPERGEPWTVERPALAPEFWLAPWHGKGGGQAKDDASAMPAEPAEPGQPDGSAAEQGKATETPPGTFLEGDADGTTFTLHHWGGVCGDYEASAEESADTVTVIVERVGADDHEVCITLAERHALDVELDAPLGDRMALDEHGEELLVR